LFCVCFVSVLFQFYFRCNHCVTSYIAQFSSYSCTHSQSLL